MTIAFAFQFPSGVMPYVGAQYFKDDSSTSDSCNSGDAKYAYYNGIFTSIGGAVAFLLEGYLGRLADVYGRKKIMYFTWFCMFSAYSLMVFTNNVWFAIGLSPLVALCGASGGISTVLQASLADSVKCKKNRTVVFSILFGIAGLVTVVAAVLVPIVVDLLGLKAPFFVFSGIMLLALLWLIFVVEETLPANKRMKQTVKYQNPCTILVEIKSNKILLWFSVVALVTAIPESGLDDIIMNYCNEQLDLCGATKTTAYDSLFSITIGVVAFVFLMVLMPLMSRCINDVGLLVVGLLFLLMVMASAALLYFVPNVVVAMSIWATFAASYILNPTVDGSLSQRLDDADQGVGIGVIHGVKGLTVCFAPYLFGGLYDLFDQDEWYVTTPFMVGAAITVCGFFIVLGPLKRTINRYDEDKIRSGKVPVNAPTDYD
eukprot:CAMPEP_0197023324 /NCGR_PEP_ID=MMETSP1384-20130603/4044_1 /TAXON_ID=29189 /ORGANISM="Ammonia sp." /LENGTH=429 /DNA_ID=CAMNT_0042451519 /DNA_START=172 /DNA_END=1461 /DNA_ORIENTATION=+